MEKIVRIGKVADQDEVRRSDIRNISPNERVMMVLRMQRDYFDWRKNSTIKRVASVKTMSFE